MHVRALQRSASVKLYLRDKVILRVYRLSTYVLVLQSEVSVYAQLIELILIHYNITLHYITNSTYITNNTLQK